MRATRLAPAAASRQVEHVIEAFWSGYFSVEYKDVSVFVILVLVLVFLPTGLLGRPEVEKV